MNLYEIKAELLNCVDEETGEIINEAMLNELAMVRDEKIENIGLWIKELKAEAEALKNEKLAFAKRQQIAENKAESLQRYLSNFLEGESFKSSKLAISFRKSKALEIDDGAMANIPDEYITYTAKPNKDDIKKAIESGSSFDGVRIVEKNNMQIR